MNEIHGLARVAKRAAMDSNDQSVKVVDGPDGKVDLHLSTSSFPAGLTPEEAEFIAQQLIDSAKRVRARAGDHR